MKDYESPDKYPRAGLFTRHGQEGVITNIDSSNPSCFYAYGYIIGDDGKKNKWSWYVSRYLNDPFYLDAADYASGADLCIEPPVDPEAWSKSGSANHPNRL